MTFSASDPYVLAIFTLHYLISSYLSWTGQRIHALSSSLQFSSDAM